MDKNQQRYIRYKLRRKIRHFYDSELPLLVEQGYISAAGDVAANSCSVAAGSHDDNNNSNNRNGAGSGTFALSSSFSSSQEGEEKRISNPRVLSDMGLAIPRPTRLGDPRSVCASLSNIILTSLIPCPQGELFGMFASLHTSFESIACKDNRAAIEY